MSSTVDNKTAAILIDRYGLKLAVAYILAATKGAK